MFYRHAAIIAAAAAFTATVTFAAETRPPNIVFILADDLGWSDLGCQGSGYYTTPHIDRLRSQGMAFSDAYTGGPNCQPTRAALMSGKYSPRTGVYTVGSIDRFNWKSRPLRPVDNVTELPLELRTVADALKQAGYATGMFGKWHLGDQPDYHPSQRGFDEAIVSAGKHYRFKTKPAQSISPETYLADWLTDRGIDFIERNQDRPFFLYLPHFGVHSPWQAKKEWIEKFEQQPPAGGHDDPVYAAMIASVDESVGRILDTLDRLGLSENTLVIFSSDNGGVGGYRREGIQTGREVTDNAPLRGGKGMLYEGGIRVPWLARWPGKIPADSTCAVPIHSVDLFPTLCAVAGAPNLAEGTDGASLLPLLVDSQADLPRGLYWHFPGYLGGKTNDHWRTKPVGVIRQGNWKLLEFFEEDRIELYDLSADRGERNDLAASQPAIAQRLRGELADWRSTVGAKMPTVQQVENRDSVQEEARLERNDSP